MKVKIKVGKVELEVDQSGIEEYGERVIYAPEENSNLIDSVSKLINLAVQANIRLEND